MTLFQYFPQEFQNTTVLTEFNKQCHLNVSFCANCRYQSAYPQDIESYISHYKTIKKHVSTYITPDPVGIIFSYFSESFVCHYCHLYRQIRADISAGKYELTSENWKERYVPTFNKFHAWEYMFCQAIWIRYSKEKITYQTFLKEEDVYKLLAQTGIIITSVRNTKRKNRKYG